MGTAEYTTPTKGFRSKSGIFEVVVCKLSEPKRAARDTPHSGSEPLIWGRQKGVTPIWCGCSDLPVFFPFALLLFQELFRFVPIWSDFFRFVFRTNEHRSGKPFLSNPFASPRKSCNCEVQHGFCWGGARSVGEWAVSLRP